MAGEIGKAVVGEMVSRGTSLLIDTYSHKCRTDIEEKLDRVDMLVRKFQSISEVSESYPVAHLESLCWWKEKFDEAARQGTDMIKLFKERASRENSTEDSQSGDDDLNKLNDVLKRLENTNTKVPDFLKFVKMNQTILVPFRSRQSSAIRRAKRTRPVPEQLCLQAGKIEPVPVPILSCLLGLPCQIANWARMMITVAAMLFRIWFSSRYSNDGEIIRVEQLITTMHNRIQDVEQEKNRSPVLAEWLKKVREVTSEGEIELHFLNSRENGLKDSSNQHTVRLGHLLSRLEKAAKDTEDIWEALTLTV